MPSCLVFRLLCCNFLCLISFKTAEHLTKRSLFGCAAASETKRLPRLLFLQAGMNHPAPHAVPQPRAGIPLARGLALRKQRCAAELPGGLTRGPGGLTRGSAAVSIPWHRAALPAEALPVSGLTSACSSAVNCFLVLQLQGTRASLMPSTVGAVCGRGCSGRSGFALSDGVCLCGSALAPEERAPCFLRQRCTQ